MNRQEAGQGQQAERGFVPKETRIQHLNKLEAAGINPYPGEPPRITHSNIEVHDRFDQLEGSEVSVVGRIVAKRDHGRTIFVDIEDNLAKLQVNLQKNGPEDKAFDLIASTYDTGDFVGATGDVFKTRTGEVTVRAKELSMLAKALLPPPSIRFGITDPEIGRRQRYLELMTNPNARERFRMRARMVQLMREEFLGYGFLEVETPVLDTTYGGANAKPFITRMNALDQDMYLRIANELYLKRLVCGNMGPVFEFSRNFRNEGMDRTHNPEFTAVELYKPYSDYNWMMNMAEKVFERIAIDLHGTTQVKFGEHTIDFKTPWKRLTIYDGLKQAYGIDPKALTDEQVQELGKQTGVSDRYQRRGDVLLALFEKEFDNQLIQPTFVLDYPKETSPLTKQHRDSPELTERFECSIAGLEVMNCYTELNDPRDQRTRFEEQRLRRLAGDDAAMPTDEDFLTAMEYGFPPMGGIGISIDRIAMILTNTSHIRDIILFPPVKKDSK